MTVIFTKQLIGFIDLLGFSDALDSADDIKMNGILALQAKMRAEVGDYFQVQTSEGPGNQRGYSSRPAISAFSDNFLVSMPTTDDFLSTQTSLAQVGRMLALIADEALTQGLLVRGGICLGDLYHQQGIAFGRGLVRAAAIEKSEAFYPRVVIDKPLAERLQVSNVLCFKDADGAQCFDYTKMIMLLPPVDKASSERERIKIRLDWPAAVLARCDQHLQALPLQSKPRALQTGIG